MEWEIAVHADGRFVEIVTRGFADSEGSLDMAKAIAATMRCNHMTNVLVDHRNIEGISGGVVEVYQRPGLFRVIGVILGIRVAEVVKPEHREHFRFLETVCVNRGYRFAIFHDRAAALEWLLGECTKE